MTQAISASLAPDRLGEFSHRTRRAAIERFRTETFDLLIVGGGITGAATARDAASRGLRVALVERADFASGTSSRSSKLIHGGLRYLETFEFGLVFEALAERALLLKTVPHLVRPLQFYLPVYRGDSHGRGILSLGLWLYDLLTLFRTPGIHRGLSRKKMLEAIPFLKSEGLRGGFRYYDASMWDDVLAVETLRGAQHWGAAVANYVEAIEPIWSDERIRGFRVRDGEAPDSPLIDLRARCVVVCAGPWTDEVGKNLSSNWQTLLNPSKGVHLMFDLKRIPVPGALVMSHPDDGRISFVIPRPDFGAGVVIVGTTDGPTPKEPERAKIDPADVKYLMDLLTRYFPELQLNTSDILSAYVGVRPLMAATLRGSEAQRENAALQKVSREHHIELGPGSTVVVAGGKYTTHRKMAEEIVDFALARALSAPDGELPAVPFASRTRTPVNPLATPSATMEARESARGARLAIPEELFRRFGGEALDVWQLSEGRGETPDPAGFPEIEAQLRYAMRNEMVIHLEDFCLRRGPLFAARADHGMPWVERLARVWREEIGATDAASALEIERYRAEAAKRDAWRDPGKDV